MDGCTDIVPAPQSAAEAKEFAVEFGSHEIQLENQEAISARNKTYDCATQRF